MERPDDSTRDDPHGGLTRRQLVAALVLCMAVAVVGGWRWWSNRRREMIDLRRPGMEVRYRVDVNRADWRELTVLKGIGPKRARAIVEHRDRHGAFDSIDDLRAVDGLPDSVIEGLKDDIRFR